MSAVHRPRLHLAAQSGWINDPLGLTFHNGLYHLFFQYVPGQNKWGPACRWGHATSPDALDWTEHPIALEPGDGDGGCWSGCVVVPYEGPAVIFYTSVDVDDFTIGKIRMARAADPSWDTWEKGKIVAVLPAGYDVVAFRDPYVFRDGEGWRMLVGAGRTDGTAVALTYTSSDLANWGYEGEFASRSSGLIDPVWTGEVWECPQFFPLGDKHVLTFAVWKPVEPFYEAYAIGTYENGVFTPEHWGRLTYGPSYYAGSAYVEPDGRRGIIYWLRGVDDPDGAWASVASLPHMLHLDGERVVAEPHPSLAARRGLDAGSPFDLEWNLNLDLSGRLLLEAAEMSVLELKADDGRLSVVGGPPDWSVPLTDATIRVVLDGPVVEIFTSNGVLALPVPIPGGPFVITAVASTATLNLSGDVERDIVGFAEHHSVEVAREPGRYRDAQMSAP